MRRVLDLYYRLLQIALTVLMGVLIVPVTMQILSRFSAAVPRYIWTEEVARFCFVWIIMIGAMIAVRDGTHFDVDVLPRSRNPKVEAALRLLLRVAMLAVAGICVWYGWRFVLFGWNQTSEIAELPMVWMFAAFPLAGVSWLLFVGEKMVEDLRLWREGRP
ncbi:MAG TPA: TRAP transporter small permease [Geminicoccaceae bacterium]|nr:TRAP transporter small permease [Geminicoccaceae bacterium]